MYKSQLQEVIHGTLSGNPLELKDKWAVRHFKAGCIEDEYRDSVEGEDPVAGRVHVIERY